MTKSPRLEERNGWIIFSLSSIFSSRAITSTPLKSDLKYIISHLFKILITCIHFLVKLWDSDNHVLISLLKSILEIIFNKFEEILKIRIFFHKFFFGNPGIIKLSWKTGTHVVEWKWYPCSGVHVLQNSSPLYDFYNYEIQTTNVWYK